MTRMSSGPHLSGPLEPYGEKQDFHSLKELREPRWLVRDEVVAMWLTLKEDSRGE